MSSTMQTSLKPHMFYSLPALVKANHIAKQKVGMSGEYTQPQEGGTANSHGKWCECVILL